jgi:hypothetical protein
MSKMIRFLIILGCIIILFLIVIILGRNWLKQDNFLIGDQPDINRFRHPSDIRGIFKPAWVKFPEIVSFIGTKNGNDYGLYQFELQSGKLIHLFSSETINFYTINQDRTQIAYYGHNKETGNNGIYVVQNGKSQLIEDNTCSGEPESWSPTNSKIITIGSCGEPLHPCICLLDLTTQDSKVFFEVKNKNESIIEASWSPDGKNIAFTYGTPPYGLYKINVDNDEIKELIEDPMSSISNPRWVNDGNWIVYKVRGSNKESQIGIIRSDGKCKNILLPHISNIDRFDFVEEKNSAVFLLVDENGNFYSLQTRRISEIKSLCQ